MKTKKLNKKRLTLFILTLLLSIILILIGIFFMNMSSINSDKTTYNFNVNEGDTGYKVIDNLKEENFIRSTLLTKLYIKIKGYNAVTGTYSLSKNMNTFEIIKVLSNKPIEKEETITIYPGDNIRDIINTLSKVTTITKEDFLSTISDTSYLDTLINKYWFLTDDIKNENIYYSLEGYLYPDTYNVLEDYNTKKVLEIILSNTEKKLSPYKEQILSNKLTIHEIFTLSSIIMLESSSSNDNNMIAGIFLNRINNNWNLGSDVTTYYGLKLDMSTRDLTQTEINDCSNMYNTRCSTYKGLPVGPISNPTISVIESVINPTESNYYYFVADKNKKTYYSKTYNEHINTINKLKKEGLWYEY